MSRTRLRIGAWPISIKAPLLAAILMVAISVVLSNRVLVRLSDTQQRHLEELAGAYLDGLSSSLIPYVLRKDIWEIFDRLDRSRERYVGLSAVYTIVSTEDNVILAASDPRRFPTQQDVPVSLVKQFDAGSNLVLMEEGGHAFVRRQLMYQGRPVGWIYAEIDIQNLLVERRRVLLALVLTNSVLTLLLSGFGYLAVRRMIQPIDVLARHLDQGRGGKIAPIPPAKIGARHSEFGRLFRRYNALVRVLNQRELLAARLAEEEKMASLGRLASGMAHEINNPLGGMFNAIDTIERHEGDPMIRRSSLQILKRGLIGIRDVVRATLVTYKSDETRRNLRASDLDDLRILVRQEINRRRLLLTWCNDLPNEMAVPAGPVRQAVLNLLLNACAASAVHGEVDVLAQIDADTLIVAVKDRGPGLPEEIGAILRGDGNAALPPIKGRGIGAWMVSRLVGELGGRVRPVTRAGGGACIELIIPLKREKELRDVA